jgi:glycosyltransferase involved in cell wall biosynthesis
MKIAQIAPLYEAVPPKLYGGTERVVHFLTEELVRLDHDVTLFASGDSKTSAKLSAIVPEALRLKKCEDSLAPHILQIEEVMDRANEFDIIHFHTDYLNFPFTKNLGVPHVTTLHGKLSIPELQPLYNKYRHQPVISISNSQRKPLPQANWVANVYHGLPCNLFRAGKGKGEYLAFLGRVSSEKGLENAIAIAIAVGIPLKVAAKIDKADMEYYEENIRELFEHPLVEYVGEVNEKKKEKFLGNAMALLFPINWEEPFGMVLIEAMACGTPVIAFNRGSVPEIIEDGQNGFVVSTKKQAIKALDQLHKIDRKVVRHLFEEKFSSARMANDYVKIYEKLAEKTGSKVKSIYPIGERKLSAI